MQIRSVDSRALKTELFNYNYSNLVVTVVVVKVFAGAKIWLPQEFLKGHSGRLV